MRLLLRLLRSLLTILLVLALVGGGGLYLWARGSLPQTGGTITVRGLSAPIEIVRDTDAIPHIRATSEADALFGLGYAHAQDRLWQMEFQRRVGSGRLAEILGEPALATDKFLRTLGPRRAAASAWGRTAREVRVLIESYVAGVNAFISAHHGRALPVEFSILGFEPELWQPEDVLLWVKMMAWDLGGTWSDEILRAKLTARLGAERAAQLMPGYTADGPLILPDGGAAAGHAPPAAGRAQAGGELVHPLGDGAYDGLLAINRTIQDALGLGGSMIGSNNWVVGGGRSATGSPLLANDPHLGAQTPSIWYLAHITGGRFDVIGATLPGVPGVAIGHNGKIAWGVTNAGPDVQDLYIERINPRNEAEHNGAWEPMRVFPEVINVKGQPDVTIQVRITRHGPLISDVTPGTGDPLAFRWTALDEDDQTLTAFLGLNIASNWGEFTAVLHNYKAPMQNFVYADVDGNIGYYAPGALPIRAAGDGSVPAPGWADTHEWTGYVPFEQLPHAYNPPQGFIVTANNQIMPAGYPHLIATNWAGPYRAARIIELITAKDKLSPDDMAAIQADVRSAQARELLPYLLETVATDERGRAALRLLRGWDGTVGGDSPEAAVYEAWFHQIPIRIFADELGEELGASYARERSMVAMTLGGLPRGVGQQWCDDVRTPQPETCADTLGRALADGLDLMAQRQGTDNVRSWRWDRAHHALFPHNPFDNVAALKPLFSREIPSPGDGFTVNVAPVRPESPYTQRHIASYRQIIDLADLTASRFIFAPGQSGHPLSGSYSNLLGRWQRGDYLPMRFDHATIDADARDRLVLEPE